MLLVSVALFVGVSKNCSRLLHLSSQRARRSAFLRCASDRVLPVRDMNRLTFGTMKIAGEFNGLVMRPRLHKQVRQILEHSYELGFRSFDTAPLYGLGASESAIGDVLCGTDIVVSTKLGSICTQAPSLFHLLLESQLLLALRQA